MDLTVVIVSYNVSILLRECILSVLAASVNVLTEIIVVDNNSGDDTCTLVHREFPSVKLIENNINAGFSAACNQAIRIAGGRFILLLNPDTLVGSDAFTRCINFMDSHPDAGALGVMMIDGNGCYLPESKRALPTPGTAFFKTFGLAFLFPGSRYINRYYRPDIGIHEISKTEVIAGAYMFIRRSVLDKTGLLDEDFFMYGEDIDLCYRILQTGYCNYYLPEVKIVHYKGKCTPRNRFTDINLFYKAMRIYIRKRSSEKNNMYLSLLIIPAIYLRHLLAILNRIINIQAQKVKSSITT